ncbi:MAG: biotin transporter BioY [Spirochaetia bacterium]
MYPNPLTLIRRISAASLFAALTAAGAYIAVPLPGSPVPLVLQNLFVLASGMILGPVWGFMSILIYLTVGALGLPVFSGGSGGLAHLAGPTGGYLLSFPLASLITGLISSLRGKIPGKTIMAGAAGALVIYAVGVTWLKIRTGWGWTASLTAGMLPFLPGDLIKILGAAGIARAVQPWFTGRRDE